MPELQFKDKKANHLVNLDGKFVRLKNGKAEISQTDVDIVKNLHDPDYTVLEGKQPEDKPDKRIKKRNKKS